MTDNDHPKRIYAQEVRAMTQEDTKGQKSFLYWTTLTIMFAAFCSVAATT